MSELIKLEDRALTRIEQYADRLDALEIAVSALVARLEQSDRSVTILHADALALQRRIRTRAADLAARYQLTEAGEKALRSGIKKAVLAQWRVKDLHDLPRRDLEAAGVYVDSWSSFALVKKIREGKA